MDTKTICFICVLGLGWGPSTAGEFETYLSRENITGIKTSATGISIAKKDRTKFRLIVNSADLAVASGTKSPHIYRTLCNLQREGIIHNNVQLTNYGGLYLEHERSHQKVYRELIDLIS